MSEKIGERHLRRKAILYIRQSTTQQLVHNEESRRLQYAMRERLGALGWNEVDVIDEDLGRSASGAVERSGFHRLVADVSLGAVGVVAARELSRFARNSRDWQQLIEVCRYVDTLLVDQDTIYDARLSNDRLLLGLKGSLNEYELDLLRLRGFEARQAKARRGEFVAKVAVGYRKRDDGGIEMTPDLRVQQAVSLAFAKTVELGSARQCLGWMRENDLAMPINRNHRGDVIWKKPSYHWLHQVLTNPIYAGAYVYGRTVVKTVFLDGQPRHKVMRRPRDEWSVLIPDHHQAYIDWKGFERIQEMLKMNAQRRQAVAPGAAKQGTALLGGLLRCRRCGQKLMVNYSGARGDVRRYVCDRDNVSRGDPRCISFSAIDIDERLARAVLDVVRPAAVELSLRAAGEATSAHHDVLAALRLELKGARYAADRAARQFDGADPENRLVVDELERRWNDALQRTREIEKKVLDHEERQRAAGTPPSPELFATLASDLDRVWNDPVTDMRLKKRIVRTLVEEIVVDVVESSSELALVVHWKGGVHTELRLPKRRRGHNRARNSPDVVDAVRALARVCTDDEIAGWLNRAEIRTAKNNRWTRALVASARNGHDIAVYSDERCAAEGWITLEKAASLVEVASVTLKRAIARGVVHATQPVPGGPWLLRRDELLRADVRERLLKKNRSSRTQGAAPSPTQLSLKIPST